jgi:hypothetical protein
MPLERVKTGYNAVYCRWEYQYRIEPQKPFKTRLNQSGKNAAWVDQLVGNQTKKQPINPNDKMKVSTCKLSKPKKTGQKPRLFRFTR